ncbi:hypothetical protein C8034_v007989 [Colletotrichum sidae]|uniref:Uncharacterized protein n=1 Tax=Colletotrichum sidae TaxID=1347389 RepID=A0A4R8TQQ7_9PEZI|nr:hypothetical protein C8034_v007989 [Colletotrichum sidae]
MKLSTILAAATVLASGVYSAPDGKKLVARQPCYDCRYKNWIDGRCTGGCLLGEEKWGSGGQNCKGCPGNCPAAYANEVDGASAQYQC